MLSIAESGSLITIGTSWLVTVAVACAVAFFAAIVHLQGTLSKGGAAGIVLASIPVLVVYNHGDRIELGPDGVREIRWYREVSFIEWRHVESAEDETIRVPGKRNTTHELPYLVLVLRTGETWVTKLHGLTDGEVGRVRAFCAERAGRR